MFTLQLTQVINAYLLELDSASENEWLYAGG